MQTDSGACGALSLLTPIGYQSGDCGYCKANDSSQRTPDSRASYYAKSKSLCPKHYQSLMDRGWRRSGSLLYLPDAARSCCPHYTIRLAASDFKPSRDQRQALNRWNRFVLGDQYVKDVAKKYPKSKAEKKQDNSTFDLLSTVHESEVASLKPDVEPEHRFEVILEPDNCTEEKFELFRNYQRHVHHESEEDISQPGFKRFLCSSPLHRHADSDGKPLGSYHHCYRLDGRLIAMGVLDLLPHAVSGVYFIYHSDFEKWSFGKLSALREATLALEQGYRYYYMGYYIHSCNKMRYKGDYKPQYVLDYDSGEWNVLDDEMRALMDKRKYASMSKERERNAASTKGRSAVSGAQDPHDALKLANDIDPNEDEPVMHPVPLDAFHSGISLLKLGMPGVMSLVDLQTINLDGMKIFLGRGDVHEMQDIVSWTSGLETDSATIKGKIAEYAACVGPDVAKHVIVDFSRG